MKRNVILAEVICSGAWIPHRHFLFCKMAPEVTLVVTIRHIRISLPIKIPSLTLSEHCMALQVKAVQYGTFLGSNGDAEANSTSRGKGSNMLDRFWGTLRTADVSSSSSSSSLQMC